MGSAYVIRMGCLDSIRSAGDLPMNSGYLIINEMGEFLAPGQQFLQLIEWLQSEESRQVQHGEIEKIMKRDGFELIRLMIQAHFDHRAALEPRIAVVKGAEGTMRHHCKLGTSRQLETPFGTVTVHRKGYNVRGCMNLHPMDAQLNLPPDKYSHTLREQVSLEASKNSFDEAVKSVLATTAGKVPKRQTEQITVAASRDFESFYDQRQNQEEEKTADLLIMTTDGKGVVMRQESLREHTRKKSERQQKDRKKARLNPGEKRNRKRMATVASVYTVAAHPRTPEEIMNTCNSDQEAKQERPRVQNKRVWASLERKPQEVTREMFDEAVRRDPHQKREWAVLVDGDERQLERIQTEAKNHGLVLTIILDFIHVLEYLWKAV
ncbi:MAG: ISKra4 family transposase, partial [Magnetococcales bacterium]|nr:ISKra4 family transposase [Magnetococcales bacterium]